jgi:glucosamine--fructose-6-phosphate aminotransferase (isomerizing)
MIARESDIAVYLHAGREVAVASTKAYVSQIVGLRLLAKALQVGPTARIPEDCLTLSTQLIKTLKQVFPYQAFADKGKHMFECPMPLQPIIEALHEKNHGFVLSTGQFRSTSYEAALKIKEIGRVWIQGYPTGALKHGPFSLIEPGTPVVFALQSGSKEVLKRTESAVEEIHARQARVFIITDIQSYENKNAEGIIHVPRNKSLGAVLVIAPFQALSYYMSLVRNLDADKPVHLAKVVTTD